jgi:hypothetical protein
MDSDMPVPLEGGQAGAMDAGGGASDAGPVPLEAARAEAADTGGGSTEGPTEET